MANDPEKRAKPVKLVVAQPIQPPQPIGPVQPKAQPVQPKNQPVEKPRPARATSSKANADGLDWEGVIGAAPSASAKKRSHAAGRGSKWIIPLTLLGVLAGAGFVGFAVYTFNHSQATPIEPDASATVAKPHGEESISKAKMKPTTVTSATATSTAGTLVAKQVKDPARSDAVCSNALGVQQNPNAPASDQAGGDPDAAALTRLLTTDPSNSVSPAASVKTPAAPPKTAGTESEKTTDAAKNSDPAKN